MSDKENLEGVMRRVKKLLAIAEDSRGDPNECAAAARMAEAIMRKYNIEHAEIICEELKNAGADAFDSMEVGAGMDPDWKVKQASGWAGVLAVAVANLYDCQARYAQSPDGFKRIKFSGYRVDVEMAKQTYIFIVDSMAAASRLYTKNIEYRARAAGEAFRRGYIGAACTKLREMTAEKKAEMQQASTSRALVVVKDQAVAAHFGPVKYGRGGTYRTTEGDAFYSGRKQGSNLDVGRRGIAGASSAVKQIAT